MWKGGHYLVGIKGLTLPALLTTPTAVQEEFWWSFHRVSVN